MKDIKITIELSEAEAMALAQFCKRSGFETFESCAINKDEAYLMIDAVTKVRSSLRDEGYNPR